MYRYKLVTVGDGGVGKTTLINRFSTGEFTKGYVPTLGIEVKQLVFNTNHGLVTFEIWDTSGQDKFSGLGTDAYAVGADAIMGMCDVTTKRSAINLTDWYNKINKNNLPSVACGNKFDINQKIHKLSQSDKTSIEAKWGMYYDISAKTNYNFEKPFLYLARKLSGYNDLEFVPYPAVTPPTVGYETVI